MNPNQWLSIRASAGSGKTFALTLRYIYLLFMGAKPNEILSITFTNKAQLEMQERIAGTLSLIAHNKNNHYTDELLSLGLTKEHIKSQGKRIYEEFLHSHNHIMTFDAFFNMVLKKFSFYAGLLRSYEIGVDFGLQDEIFSTSLEKISSRDFADLVNFCQDNNLSAKNILTMLDSIHIDEVAYNDIESNINPTTISIHDLCELVVTPYHQMQRYIFDFADSNNGVERVRKRFLLEVDNNANLATLLNMLKNVHLTDKMLESLEKNNYDKAFFDTQLEAIKKGFRIYFSNREKQALKVILRMYKIYYDVKLEILRRHNKLSFGDVNAFCYDLLNKHIDNEFFYFRLDSRINHILIDEFQDTNIKQYLILKPLIDEIKSGIGRIGERSLFFVGDEKQAIYGFRGSDSRLFKAISEVLKMDIQSLPTNYRSAKNIVSFVNNVFESKFIDYQPQAVNSTNDGYVEVLTTPKEEILSHIKQRVEFLLGNNRNNIAILTRKTSTAKGIYEYLLKEIPHIKIAIKLKDSIDVDFLVLINALKYMKTNESIYLKNAIKLNGKSYFTDISLDIDSTLPPIQIVLLLMYKFEIYSKVAIFLLENAAKYDTLDEFVDSLDFIQIEIDEEKECDIKIMNIHNAKGLEFSDVILTEYGGESRDNDVFYYDYNGLKLQDIVYLKDSLYRRLVDSAFDNIVEKRNNENSLDSINLLYVAFTRAKESLYIIKPPKGTIFDNVDLKDCKIGVDIANNPIMKAETTHDKILISQHSFGRQNDFIQNEMREYNNIGRIKGIALHLALEYYLKYKSNAELHDILMNRFGLVLNNNDINDVLNSMNRILHNEIINDILDRALKIQCEVLFLNKARAMRRIDCIVYLDNGMVILDYKSSDFDLETKEKQVREYIAFVQDKMTPKNVVAYLCFANGKIHQIK